MKSEIKAMADGEGSPKDKTRHRTAIDFLGDVMRE